MKIEELQARAKQVGVVGVTRKTKTRLIHAIQLIEGNRPCYVSPNPHCQESWQEVFSCKIVDCCWRNECLCAIVLPSSAGNTGVLKEIK